MKRTAKIGLFSEITIGHLLKLYERAVAENADGDHIPADLVYHFLLAICTQPGLGICFRDGGWYPCDTDADFVDKPKKSGKIYNKILSNILKSLSQGQRRRSTTGTCAENSGVVSRVGRWILACCRTDTGAPFIVEMDS